MVRLSASPAFLLRSGTGGSKQEQPQSEQPQRSHGQTTRRLLRDRAKVSAILSEGLHEQVARIKWLGLQLRVAGRVEPFFARAIVVQLDPVAIRVAQVD